MKIKEFDNGHRMFYCPACEDHHAFSESEKGWTIQGEGKTLSVIPSILVTRNSEPEKRCHLFIINGRIKYLRDCTHSMAGQTIDLPDVREDKL